MGGEQSYSHKTLVNNWNEDLQQLEGKFDEYRCRKLQGKLYTDLIERRQEFARQPAPLSQKNLGDEILFGDAIMLSQSQTSTFLSVEPKAGEEWIASTAATSAPQARNVFHVVSPGCSSDTKRSALKYGQAFCLLSEPVLSTDEEGMMLAPYFLKSIPKSFSAMARLSTESKVVVEQHYSENALWVVESAARGNQGVRMNRSGNPVLAGDEVIIKHKMTNTPLSVDKTLHYKTNLSDHEEFEAFCCVNNRLLPRCTWSFKGSAHKHVEKQRNIVPFSLDVCKTEVVAALGGREEVATFLDKLTKVNSTDAHEQHGGVVLSIEELRSYIKSSLRAPLDDRKIDIFLSHLATNGRIQVEDLASLFSTLK